MGCDQSVVSDVNVWSLGGDGERVVSEWQPVGCHGMVCVVTLSLNRQSDSGERSVSGWSGDSGPRCAQWEVNLWSVYER
jgi:hypothetical protein